MKCAEREWSGDHSLFVCSYLPLLNALQSLCTLIQAVQWDLSFNLSTGHSLSSWCYLEGLSRPRLSCEYSPIFHGPLPSPHHTFRTHISSRCTSCSAIR